MSKSNQKQTEGFIIKSGNFYLTQNGQKFGVLGDQSTFLPVDRIKFYRTKPKLKRTDTSTIVDAIKHGSVIVKK